MLTAALPLQPAPVTELRCTAPLRFPAVHTPGVNDHPHADTVIISQFQRFFNAVDPLFGRDRHKAVFLL